MKFCSVIYNCAKQERERKRGREREREREREGQRERENPYRGKQLCYSELSMMRPIIFIIESTSNLTIFQTYNSGKSSNSNQHCLMSSSGGTLLPLFPKTEALNLPPTISKDKVREQF